MSRLLRVKADLQQVVISADYAKQKFSRGGAQAAEDGEELDKDIGSKVKAIILDEEGFWKPLMAILYVAMPLIKLLRLLDGNKAAIGKIYDRMFTIGQRIDKLKGPSRGLLPWPRSMRIGGSTSTPTSTPPRTHSTPSTSRPSAPSTRPRRMACWR